MPNMTAWMSLWCERCTEAFGKNHVFMGNFNSITCVFSNHLKRFWPVVKLEPLHEDVTPGTFGWDLFTWDFCYTWVSFGSSDSTGDFRSQFNNQVNLHKSGALPAQGLKLGVISELKTSLVRVGMGNRLRRISSESSKRNSVIVGDCWWFLVDANHRSEVIANYQQNSGSWCPVWVQVSLMLLVVEELVGCASPFLDRDSTLICSCFKSTQHSTDQKIAVLCCSFSERTLESTFRFDLSNLADGVLSLLSYLVRPRFKPIFHHP